MTPQTIQAIVHKLYELNSFQFLNLRTNSKTVKNYDFVITIKDELTKQTSTYELKDEYKEMVTSLSFSEIVQIFKINNSDIEKNVLSIKKWVKFFGILTVIALSLYVLIAIVLPFIIPDITPTRY